MGGWPWERPDVYRRNSATSYAAQARTPTLFLMADPDHGGIDETGGVQFLYAALRRHGVETQFVRYLNEGHVLAAPANRRDAFNRAVWWIDCHLAGDAARVSE
jgi:dipeptidyl aminopeptidase/acylaminoacyl peptidase